MQAGCWIALPSAEACEGDMRRRRKERRHNDHMSVHVNVGLSHCGMQLLVDMIHG